MVDLPARSVSPAPTSRAPTPQDTNFRNKGKTQQQTAASAGRGGGGGSLCRFLGTEHDILAAATWPRGMNETLCCPACGRKEEGVLAAAGQRLAAPGRP